LIYYIAVMALVILAYAWHIKDMALFFITILIWVSASAILQQIEAAVAGIKGADTEFAEQATKKGRSWALGLAVILGLVYAVEIGWMQQVVEGLPL